MFAIKAESVSKSFRIPHQKKTTLFEHLSSLISTETGGYDEFWALKDVSFDLEQGETLGVIGRNGSGKSTLLKIIAGIYPATKGRVRTNGRIVPFIELGVGFKPELTGRENVYLYGSIMGLTRQQIDAKYAEIVEFSELDRFMDTKLKNYSSGMQVRLAFATAIQTKPDLLLIDEVLAVGDMAFQQKCLDVMQEYIAGGKSVILVSHDLNSVRRFCTKALLLKNGAIGGYGKSDDVINQYIDSIEKMEKAKQVQGERWGTKEAVINQVELLDKFGNQADMFFSGEPMTMRIHYETKNPILKPIFGVAIHSDKNVHCFGTNTEMMGPEIKEISGKGYVDLILARINFSPGKYYLSFAIAPKDHSHYDWRNKEFVFNVSSNAKTYDGLFEVPCRWTLPKKEGQFR